MKILMTGGGTAGHVTPNIALIPKLMKEGYEISYIGTENGMEKELITNEGIKYYSISAGKLRRYLSIENLTDIAKIGKGFFESSKHIRDIKPDVVFSKGGFVSCPVVWAAWFHKIPTVIHESDLTPGLANKLSIPFAKKVCYAFPETAKYLPVEKSELSGIPVREKMLRGSKRNGLKKCNFTSDKPVILIIGGSLGSQAINNIIRDSLDELLKQYQVCHICGKGSIDENLNNISGYMQFEYVSDELKDLFAMSDIVISRAGATTLYELLNLAKPNILIPLPKAVSRGDQILNAFFFRKEGYSEVLQEEDITKEKLISSIDNVLKNKQQYINAMKSSNIRDSISTVVSIIDKERKAKDKKKK